MLLSKYNRLVRAIRHVTNTNSIPHIYTLNDLTTIFIFSYHSWDTLLLLDGIFFNLCFAWVDLEVL